MPDFSRLNCKSPAKDLIDCGEDQLVSLVFQNPRFADNGDIGSCDTSLTMSAELTRGNLRQSPLTSPNLLSLQVRPGLRLPPPPPLISRTTQSCPIISTSSIGSTTSAM